MTTNGRFSSNLLPKTPPRRPDSDDGRGESIRHKSFTYKTSASWKAGKCGALCADGKPEMLVTCPEEFHGESGVWTPEEMFVGAVEVCHMVTFKSFAAKRQLHILSYTSHANGVLEFVDGDYRFTRIVIFPTVVVAKGSSEIEVHTALRDAERHCLLANSIASIVEVNPTLIIGDVP
jgi:organic hydroperoxide reductase OsmC/OhrA